MAFSPFTVIRRNGKTIFRFCGLKIFTLHRKLGYDLCLDAIKTTNLKALFDITQVPVAHGWRRNMQLAEVELLKEIARVCHENSMDIWLEWGTLLGAIRHKGHFVPWDDDLDLGMMTDDYDRFVDIFNRMAQDGYSACYQWNLNWNHIVVTHRDIPTCVVDIFRFTWCGEGLVTVDEKIAFTEKMRSLQLKTKVWPGGERAYVAALNRALFGSDSTSAIKRIGAVTLAPEFCPPAGCPCVARDSEDMFPLVETTFEGVSVCVPRRADRVLTYLYGDFMSYPSSLEPKSEHAYRAESRSPIDTVLRMLDFLEARGIEADMGRLP